MKPRQYYQSFLQEAEMCKVPVPKELREGLENYILNDGDRIFFLPEMLDIIASSESILTDQYFMEATIKELHSLVRGLFEERYM